MRKVFCLINALILTASLLFVPACSAKTDLIQNVVELRENVYQGQSKNYSLKAAYGFKTSKLEGSPAQTQKIFKLSFKLTEKETDDVTYTLKLVFNEQEYYAAFSFNPVADCLTSSIEVENFSLNEFAVTVCAGSQTEEVNMRSLLPEGTLTVQGALDFLIEKQPDLIESYKDENGAFAAQIYARIMVKNEKAYWYIGFDRGQNNLKALLVDGQNGEILAIRDIF